MQGWGSCRLADLVEKLTKLAIINWNILENSTCYTLIFLSLIKCYNDYEDDLTIIGWFSVHWKNSPVNMMFQPASQLLHLLEKIIHVFVRILFFSISV